MADIKSNKTEGINLADLNEIELDALKEIGNIGASHAATALSQLVERTIMINVSNISVIPVEKIAHIVGGSKDPAISVHLRIWGDVMGGIMLLMSLDGALTLSNLFSNESLRTQSTLSNLEVSGLKKTGSILSAAYLHAISDFLQLSLIPSVPGLTKGEGEVVVKRVLDIISKRSQIALCINTEFLESEREIKGHFLLIPEVGSLVKMVKSLSKASKRMQEE